MIFDFLRRVNLGVWDISKWDKQVQDELLVWLIPHEVIVGMSDRLLWLVLFEPLCYICIFKIVLKALDTVNMLDQLHKSSHFFIKADDLTVVSWIRSRDFNSHSFEILPRQVMETPGYSVWKIFQIPLCSLGVCYC